MVAGIDPTPETSCVLKLDDRLVHRNFGVCYMLGRRPTVVDFCYYAIFPHTPRARHQSYNRCELPTAAAWFSHSFICAKRVYSFFFSIADFLSAWYLKMSCLYFYSLRLFTSSNVDPLCACSLPLLSMRLKWGSGLSSDTLEQAASEDKWNNLKKAQNSFSGIQTDEDWKRRRIQICFLHPVLSK